MFPSVGVWVCWSGSAAAGGSGRCANGGTGGSPADATAGLSGGGGGGGAETRHLVRLALVVG